MEHSEVLRIAHVQKRINELKAKLPAVTVSLEGDTSHIYDEGFLATYKQDEVLIRRRGLQPEKSIVLPEGIRFECLGSAKNYLLFTNGADKEVNYLLPSEGLTVKRLCGNRYHAVNPIQDYIVELDPHLKKAENALCEQLREYCRAMYQHMELPTDFRPLKEYEAINYRDKTNWFNFLVQYKFYRVTDDHWDRHKLRVRKTGWKDYTVGKLNESPKGLITKINEYFEANHLGYSVKKKSPFTPPHHNEFWRKLETLREAGLVPE